MHTNDTIPDDLKRIFHLHESRHHIIEARRSLDDLEIKVRQTYYNLPGEGDAAMMDLLERDVARNVDLMAKLSRLLMNGRR